MARRPAVVYLQVLNGYSERNGLFVQCGTDDPATAPKVAEMLPVVPAVGLDFSL